MDVLTIRIERPEGFAKPVVRLLVNGQDFIALVEAFERAFAGDVGGAYFPISSDTLPPSGHFHGDPDSAYREDDGRVALLGCRCGEPGCWPLLARITSGDREVQWSEFEQPHRPEWRFDGFGPFVFDRAQYDAAIAEAVRRTGRRHEA
jgi:hypothetical protein